MAHGNFAGLPSNGDFNYPIPFDAVARANLDYLALGHWHSFSPFKTGGIVRMAYCGTPETTAFGVRDSGLVSIGVEPMFDSIRSDPRFKEIVRRMKLAN